MGFGETLIWKNPWCSAYIHGNFPTAKTCLWHPEDGTWLDQEDFGKGTSSLNLMVVEFTRPASFLTISPLEDVSTFNVLLHRVGNLSTGWRGRRRNNERQALDDRTGKCHYNFQSRRRIKQRLSLPAETTVGAEAHHRFCGQLPKKRVDKWSSGNFNSQICRIMNYDSPSKPEMQISNTKKSHFPSVKVDHAEKSVKTRNAGQAREKREPCYADGWDVNCQRPLCRTVWCFLKHLKNTAREHRALRLMGV